MDFWMYSPRQRTSGVVEVETTMTTRSVSTIAAAAAAAAGNETENIHHHNPSPRSSNNSNHKQCTGKIEDAAKSTSALSDNSNRSNCTPTAAMNDNNHNHTVTDSKQRHFTRRSFGEELIGHSNITTTTTATATANAAGVNVPHSRSRDDTVATADSTLDHEDGIDHDDDDHGLGLWGSSTLSSGALSISSSQNEEDASITKPSTTSESFSKSSTLSTTTLNHQSPPLPKEVASRNAPSYRASSSSSTTSYRSHSVVAPKMTTDKQQSLSSYKNPYNYHHHRSHLVPVRIHSSVDASKVQATDAGYASVAELSKWLADDPTKPKNRIKQIRRGANVISKSRKFDKELHNIQIIEADALCQKGGVREKQKAWLVQQTHKHHQHLHDNDDDDNHHDIHLQQPHRLSLDTTGSGMSVQDKKKWLANAFVHHPSQNNSSLYSTRTGGGSMGSGKAMTDIGAARSNHSYSQEVVDEITLRAKEMWRHRVTTSSPPPCACVPEAPSRLLATTDTVNEYEPSSSSASSSSSNSTCSFSTDEAIEVAMETLTTKTSTMTPGTKITNDGEIQSFVLEDRQPDKPQSNALVNDLLLNMTQKNDLPVSKDVRKSSNNNNNHHHHHHHNIDHGTDQFLAFQSARDLLVQRSRQNDNPVNVISKVSRRKALFEQIEKVNRRKSSTHGSLKPVWKPDHGNSDLFSSSTTSSSKSNAGSVHNSSSSSSSSGAAVGGQHYYKKAFVADTAPKKRIVDLP